MPAIGLQAHVFSVALHEFSVARGSGAILDDPTILKRHYAVCPDRVCAGRG